MKIAAIADIHTRVNSFDQIDALFDGIDERADALILAGDLTDSGLPAEMEVLLSRLRLMKIPIVAVLGNHDHESDVAEKLSNMLISAGVHVLDGTAVEFDGVGFVGTKGFAGGFGKCLVQPFGERALKTFIQSSIDEAIRLENALTKLDCPYKVAVLHYSPITETLIGEPEELYPFLGSSRLMNALDRHGVEVIFHGHAHHGSPEGSTQDGTPVYNVSRFVRTTHDLSPYCMFEVGETVKVSGNYSNAIIE